MKVQLCIEKTTISRLTNLTAIKGGETIGTLDCQFISRYPNICPPTTEGNNSCEPCPTTAGFTTDCP